MVTADSVWSLLLACSSCSKVVVTAVGGMITMPMDTVVMCGHTCRCGHSW